MDFEKELATLNLTLTPTQLHQFQSYYDLLIEWNRVMNLTGITEYDEVLEKHFYDSLCLLKAVPLLSAQKLIDVGTGAGFPGIPLKIAFPQLDIVLMDSLNKRLNFLNEVIQQLGLTSITTLHGRAEDLARKPAYRQQFDLCVSRAVANLSTLSEYCLPFVKQGGSFVSYKSGDVEAELNDAKNAIYLLGGTVESVTKFSLPASNHSRSLVCIKKERGTPKAYPRKAGTPAKNPLS